LVADREGFQIRRAAANILNKQSQATKQVGSSSFGSWAWGFTPHGKIKLVTECCKGHMTWTDSLERLKLNKIDMRFGTWNISSFYRAGSLRTVARQLAKHELYLEDYRKSDGTGVALNQNSYGNGNENHELTAGFLYTRE
jgi:hypothetical protein